MAPEVICGSDGRKDIICYGQQASNAVKPVARLLFAVPGGQALCTGWLVRGSNDSTLITNNHCISDQNGVNSLQAKFNFQHTKCGGTVDEPSSDYAGGTFLRTSASLDYTLQTLQGNPEATWGELIPTTLEPTAESRIVFPQHPGGNEKKVGAFEDSAQTIRCFVISTHQTYSPYAPGSQFNYGCDSEGGASGSPIINASDRDRWHVWGLHHLGQVTINPCSNGATHMSTICREAGALLTCAAD